MKGIDTKNIDTSVRPQDDFYLYACGQWIKNTPLPADHARFGTFDQMRETNREQIKELITELHKDPRSKKQGSIQQKISDLYMMGMDSGRLNREGAEPLKPQLYRIAATTKETLFNTVSWLHNGIAGVFFTTGVGVDPKNSNRHLMFIGQCGLGLGDRDYYLVDDENNRRIMQAYRKYLVKLMTLVGYPIDEAKRVRDNVLFIETELARVKHSREESRDPLLRFNMRTREQIITDYPNIPWVQYFKALNVEMPENCNVTNPKFMKRADTLFSELSLQQIKDYMACSAISGATGLLSDDFYEVDFEMYSRVMSGVQEQKPRWKRALAIPTSMFAEAVGELYVDRYFPPSSKKQMIEMVTNLRSALKQHISELTWMCYDTKEKALQKLNKMTVKIGYPDKWKDYSELSINPADSYLENVRRASEWYTQDNYGKLYKPVDKDEWFMSPHTINAYYSPSVNEICFPAGILQPPFFDPEADDAVNYGAIGVVIGHEMTHGFDDQGRHFDADGNLQDWWTAEDENNFKQLTAKLVEQFNAIEVAPGVNANGEFTLGENIADQGGVRLAITAYGMSGANRAMEIDGFSAMQRFFISYANVWKNNIRPEEIISATKTDPHSLGCNRTNATLKNIDEFFEALRVNKNDMMWRPESERVVIW